MPDEQENAPMQEPTNGKHQVEPSETEAMEQLHISVDALERKIEDLKVKAVAA